MPSLRKFKEADITYFVDLAAKLHIALVGDDHLMDIILLQRPRVMRLDIEPPVVPLSVENDDHLALGVSFSMKNIPVEL